MFADPIRVNLTAYNSQGRPYPLLDQVVEPRTHLELSLNRALDSAPPEFLQGSLSLEYRGEASTVSAWAVLQRGGHATEIPFSTASQYQSTTLRAFWDTRPLGDSASMVPTYAVVNTASTPLDYSVTIAGERGTRRLGPQARQVIRVPVDIQKGSLVIEHQGLPGDLVGAGLLQGRIGGKLALAPLPVVDPARLDSTRHHVLRAPSTGQRRTWLTLYNPTAVSQRATLSAFDATRGRRLARKRQSIAAGRVQTVRLDALLAEAEGTLPKEVRLRIDHPGDPASLLVSGTRLSRAGQVWSLPCFQDSQAHHNGTYPLLNLSRGAVATTWLNLGSKPAKVVAQLDWAEGGAYALPEITIASGASYRLDFAELLRRARPDLLDREISPSYQKGFFRWSARGGSRRLLARTEVNPVEGAGSDSIAPAAAWSFPTEPSSRQALPFPSVRPFRLWPVNTATPVQAGRWDPSMPPLLHSPFPLPSPGTGSRSGPRGPGREPSPSPRKPPAMR